MRVTYSDIYTSTGRITTIGSAMNDLKGAYLEAIDTAIENQNQKLVDSLEQALRVICEADSEVLEAICQQ